MYVLLESQNVTPFCPTTNHSRVTGRFVTNAQIDTEHYS